MNMLKNIINNQSDPPQDSFLNKNYTFNKVEPAPFIIFDSTDKKFKLSEEGKQVISSIEGPFGIITVAGMYRTGKSYLINKVLLGKETNNKSSGFVVGNTVNPCTKGLWIWPEPIECTTSDGKPCKALIIDTEGFGAFDEDQNHDYKIFTLATLLSSMFIYNSIGTIDETAIQSLSFVVNLTKKLELQQSTKTSIDNEFFPNLMWVVRDFMLQLQNENGDRIEPQEYLEMALNSVSSSSNKSSDESKNNIRKSIKSHFKNRDCFLMVRPITDEKKLQNLSALPESELRSEFLAQVLELKNKITKNIKIKEFNKACLQGEPLLDIISNYIKAINEGGVPQIENLFSNICISESNKALENAEKLYDSLMKEVLNNNTVVCKKQIKNAFNSNTNNKENANVNKGFNLNTNLKSIVAGVFTNSGINLGINNNSSSLSSINSLSNVDISSNSILNLQHFTEYHKAFKQQTLLLFTEKMSFALSHDNAISNDNYNYNIELSKFSNKKVQETFNNLINLVKDKKQFFKDSLFEETKGFILKILHFAYSKLEQDLLNKETKLLERNLEPLFQEIEKISNQVVGLFPDMPFTLEYLNDFKSNILSLTINIIKSNKDNDVELSKQEKEMIMEKYHREKSEIEQMFKSQAAKSEQVMLNLKSTIADLKNELNDNKTTFTLKDQDTSTMIDQLNDKILQIKDENNRKINELNLKLEQEKEKSSEAERLKITVTSEIEKEKALLNQIIDHQTKQIEEYKKNDKDSNKELMTHYKEQQIAFKERNTQHNKEVSELSNKINSLNEKIIDLENNLSKLSFENTEEIKKNSELSESLKKLKDNYLVKENELNEALNKEKLKINNETSTMKEEYDKTVLSLKSKLNEQSDALNTEIKELKDKNVLLVNENKSLSQKLEFSFNSISEFQEKIMTMKQNHDSLINKLQINSGKESNEEFTRKINELKDYYEKDKKNIIDSNDKIVLSLNNKIEGLNELINKETKVNELEKNQLLKEKEDLKSKIDSLTYEVKSLERKKKEGLSQYEQLSEENSQEMLKLKEDYEKQIDILRSSNMKELSDINTNSEEQIKKLRTMFDFEKEKLEQKLKTEKSTAERKLKNTIDDYENKLSDLEIELKNEIEILNNELADLRREFDDYINRAEKEVDLLKQSKDTLEGLWEASKQALVKNQQQYKQSYENLVESSTKERNELLKRNEFLNSEFLSVDRELVSTKLKKEQLEKEASEMEKTISHYRIEIDEVRKEAQDTIQKMSTKLGDITEEFTIKKLEFNRENALLKQQIEFLNKKIEELKEQMENTQHKYEEKLITTRIEMEKDFTDRLEKLEREKESIDFKKNSIQKELRDLEQTFLKQSALQEKEKALLQERYDNSEANKKYIQETYQKEIEKLIEEEKALRHNYQKELDEFHNKYELLLSKSQTTDIELKDKSAKYTKEVTSLENRCKFLEDQRDKYKSDHVEEMKKGEMMRESYQDKLIQEIERLKSDHAINMSNMEAKYKKQIAELQEAHKSIFIEMTSSYKDLQSQLNSLNLQSDLNSKRGNDPHSLMLKVQELLDVKENLKEELEQVKQTKDQRIRDVKDIHEKEKDQLNQKISLLENRLRETENKKNTLSFELEKLTASLNMDKNQLLGKLSDSEEHRRFLEDELEKLAKELEKYKLSGNPNNPNNNFGNRVRGSVYNSSNTNNSILNTNSNTNPSNYNTNYNPNNYNNTNTNINPNNNNRSFNFNTNTNTNNIEDGRQSNINNNINQREYNYNKTNQSLNMSNIKQPINSNVNNNINTVNTNNNVNYNHGGNNLNYSYNYNPKNVSNMNNNNVTNMKMNYNNNYNNADNMSNNVPNNNINNPNQSNNFNLDSSQISRRGNYNNMNNMNNMLGSNMNNNFNPDFSNIDPDDFQFDDEKFDKNVMDSSFTSSNSIRLEFNNLKNNKIGSNNNLVSQTQNNMNARPMSIQRNAEDNDLKASLISNQKGNMNNNTSNNVNQSGVYQKRNFK